MSRLRHTSSLVLALGILATVVAPAAPASAAKVPLVLRTVQVPGLPSRPVHCDEPTVPNRHGSVTGMAPQPNGGQALAVFLYGLDGSTPPFDAGRGYLRLVTPSGKVAFAKEFVPGPGYVAIVRMAQLDGGWVVDSWQVSGC